MVRKLGIASVLFVCSLYGAETLAIGSYGVSAAGSAQYSVPIWTPPGVGQIQPQLALVYDSNSGPGIMGPGWNLSGLSAITRCNLTYAQDGVNGAVTLTAADRFCLDGNRLRLTSSETLSTYGAPSTTYQTEIANFSLVTASAATAGNGPASFIVQGKNGLTYEYGATTDSRVLVSSSNPTPYIWALDKVTDRSGNYMTYTYAQTNGTYQLNSILYGASTASPAPLYQVNFTYGPTTNPIWVRYLGGAELQSTSQLTTISVQLYNSSTDLRVYNLAYSVVSATNPFQDLIAILECGGPTGSDCLQPTQIAYQAGANGVSNPTLASGAASGSLQYSLDMNGDGRKDLIYTTVSNGNSHWWVQFASGTGYSAAIDTGLISGPSDPVLFDDFLGNGKISILAPQSGVWTMFSWNGSSFVTTPTGLALDTNRQPSNPNDYATADVNGDGLPDLVAVLADGSLYTRLNTGGGTTLTFGAPTTTGVGGVSGTMKIAGNNQFPSSSIQHVDINGDGRDDIIYTGAVNTNCHLVSGGLQCTLSPQYQVMAPNGTGFSVAFGGTFGGSPSGFIPLHINDDACTDFTIPGSNLIYIAGCNGSTATTITAPANIVAALDWNSDGRTDLLTNTNGTWQIYESTGVSLTPISAAPFAASGTLVVTDQDGDGMDDVVYANPSAGNSFYLGLHEAPSIKHNLAGSFLDPNLNSFSPTYAPLTQSSVYLNFADAVYPYKNYIGPLYVVSQSTFSDASNLPSGTYTQTMSYFGAWTNVQGRGFSGFNDYGNLDSRNGVWEVKSHRRDFPYTGLPSADWISQPNTVATFSVKTNNAFPTLAAATLDATANNQRYFPYVLASTSSYYELGGALNGDLITTSATTWTYDSNGNATNVSTSVTDNDPTPTSTTLNDVWTTTTATTFAPANSSTWCLNLPTEKDVTNTPPSALGAPAITRHVTYTSNSTDTSMCRVTQRIAENGNSLYQLTAAFTYDAFGNITGQTNTGVNMPAGIPATRTTSVTWGATGQFPVTETNALNQVTQTTFDPNTGQLLSVKDANNLVTSWQYDDFARKSKETQPDGTLTTWAYNGCRTGCFNSNNKWTVVQTNLNTDGSPLNIQNTYLDSLERVLAASKQMLNGAYYLNEIRYDSLGNVLMQGVPSTIAAGTQSWITNAYDALNRLTSSQRPTSATVSTPMTTSYTYQGRTNTVRDPPTIGAPSGAVSTKISLPIGLLAKTQDNSGYSINFIYDAFGSLLTATDNSSPAITLQKHSYAYGINAFKIASTDADLGAWTWSYDAFGEMTSYVDAKGQNFSYLYDALSRPTQRTEPDPITPFTFVTNWTWGSSAANFNIGKLQSVTAASSPGTYSEGYVYDNKGRLSTKTIAIPGVASYTYTQTYNATTGLLDTLTYPVSTASYQMQLKYSYANGILQQISDITAGGPGTTYWTANTMNPRGQILQETLGNGVVVNHTFDAVTAFVNNIQAGRGGGAALQNNSYVFDAVGNLTQRQDGNANVTENPFPDKVYRLDHTVGDTNTQMTYDAMGRIATWTAYGATVNVNDYSTPQSGCTYYPDHAQPHAVRKDTQGGNVSTSCYDANGNLTTQTYNGSPMSVFWTGFNQPSSINSGSSSSQFFYDANHQRFMQQASYSGAVENTIYIGGLLEKMSNSSGTAYRHYIPAGNNTIVYTRLSSGTNSTYYLTQDHLGSTAVITDQTGNSIQKETFAALGWPESSTSVAGTVSRHEFTGQENLDNLFMVNMNGRVYQPSGSYFISPDPHITDPTNPQNYNRYAYVLNNPLTYADPTGYDCSDPAPHPAVCGDTSSGAPPASNVSTGSGSGDSGVPFEFFVTAQLSLDDWLNNIFANNIDVGMFTVTTTPASIESIIVTAPRKTAQSPNPCPGANGPASAFRASAPNNPSLGYTPNNVIPSNAQQVTAPNGTVFYAPPNADFAAVYTYGTTLAPIPSPLNTGGLQFASGFGGLFDFQRGNNLFNSSYAYASNYAIGILAYSANVSLSYVQFVAGLVKSASGGQGFPSAPDARAQGYAAAQSGACLRP